MRIIKLLGYNFLIFKNSKKFLLTVEKKKQTFNSFMFPKTLQALQLELNQKWPLNTVRPY